jgi:16S rRNA (guanine966-N2)-methyltransferase
MIKGAIFSMLAARRASFAHVLDLFAGSGALAIEALSRGEGDAVLVERDRAACAVIVRNLERAAFEHRARVICAALPQALDRLEPLPFSAIFLDPPYAETGIDDLFAALVERTLVADESTIVYEHSRRTMPPTSCGPLRLAVTRVHGESAISLYDQSGV